MFNYKTPQQIGREFEKINHEFIKQSDKHIMSETEIKQNYGQHITGIDHKIESDDYIILIQDKWQQTKPSNSQANHFINCVNFIQKQTTKKIFGIYLSNLEPSKYAYESFKNSETTKCKYMAINGKTQNIVRHKLMEFLYSIKIYFYDDYDNNCVVMFCPEDFSQCEIEYK